MERNEDLFLMTLSDFVAAFKKNKKKILAYACIFACLAFFYAISRPVEYIVQGTFKEKAAKESGLGSNALTSLLGGADAGKSEAIAIFKSHRLLQEVIKKHQIQGTLVKKEWKFPLLRRIKENLRIEYAYFRNRQIPVLKDPEESLSLTALDYNGEGPVNLTLQFLADGTFAVFDKEQNFAGKGQFDVPFQVENVSFMLEAPSPANLDGQEYTLAIKSLPALTQELLSRLTIEVDSVNKSIIKMSYKYPNRHLACLHLNSLMYAYQGFLYKEHQRVAQEQITYLEKRHEKIGQNLQKMMESFAERISLDVTDTGFVNTEAGMHFFAEALQKLKQRLLDIQMEIERLQKAQSNEMVFLERFGANDSQAVNAIFNEMRTLKQECDGLTLAIRRTTNSNVDEAKFARQIQEYESTQNHADEARLLLARVQENRWQGVTLKHLNHSDYFVSLWLNKLSECEAGLKTEKEVNFCKTNFISYLNQLLHYFDVRQKSLQERISRQQSSQEQFQGIGLSTAHSLYVQYSNEIGNVETLLKQKELMVSQLEEDDFEVSSLSPFLTDTVSRQMIDRASTLALSLQDDSNRSAKEHARLREELNVQKKFLKSHLKQTQELGGLQIELLSNKILALQNTILELNQQKISILQSHLNDFLQNRLTNLHQEKELVNRQLKELQQQLHLMPTRWVAEKMINQQMASNQKMVEELNGLVGAKNIASNLEIIQSAPLDVATPPLHPKSPHLVLMTFLGAFLGVLFGMGKVAFDSLSKGMVASEENLTASDFKVVGRLSASFNEKRPSHKDLETLRKTAAFLHSCESQVVLLLDANAQEYCRALASLLASSGLKTLIMPLTQSRQAPYATGGLIPFLEGDENSPKILSEGKFDFVLAGKKSAYETELLTSVRFKEYLKDLEKNYDYTFVISHALPCSSEAEMLLKNFETAVISLREETLMQLKDCCLAIHQENRKNAFVFVDF